MQITLEALENAFAPIVSIGQGEMTFDIGGTNITIKVLVSEEEIEVQKYATATPDTEDASSALEYLERFKAGVLSHAIIAINDQDFRDAELVELAEKTPAGVPVKVKRYLAMRQIVAKWSTALKTAVFRKYTELLKQVEDKAEKAIKFQPSDIDAEIDRLKRKLEQLETEKKNQVEEPSPFSKVTKGISEIEQTPPVVQPQVQQEPVKTRQPITPQQVTQSVIPPAPQPKLQVEEQPIVNPIRGLAGVADSITSSDDSFIDASDANAIDRENQRLFKARMQRQGLPPAPSGSVLDTVRKTQPQNLVPRNADIEAVSALENAPMPNATPEPAMRMPTEELVVKTEQVAPKVAVNPAGVGGANPRFKPAPKGF